MNWRKEENDAIMACASLKVAKEERKWKHASQVKWRTKNAQRH
jgi:hypothetical protein